MSETTAQLVVRLMLWHAGKSEWPADLMQRSDFAGYAIAALARNVCECGHEAAEHNAGVCHCVLSCPDGFRPLAERSEK